MILHIFMYNVISDFSAATPASEGRVKACSRAVEHRSSTAMLKHAVEWSSTHRAQPLELLSVMTSTEGAQ